MSQRFDSMSVIAELAVGLEKTISLTLGAWLVGGPLGIVLSFFCVISPSWRSVVRLGAVFLSVVPFLAILFWIHYPLQEVLAVVWPPVLSTGALLCVYVTVLVGEIVGEEMRRIERRLLEAGKVLGIPVILFYRRVVFAASIEASLPRLLALVITSIHLTMFASLIGVEELFRVTQRLNAEFLKPVELFTAMAGVYAIVCIPLHIAAGKISKVLRDRNA